VGTVFFSLAGRVRLWDGRRIRSLAETGREARRLAVRQVPSVLQAEIARADAAKITSRPLPAAA